MTRDYFYNALLKEYQSINWATGNFQEKFSDNLNEQIGGLMNSTQDRLELLITIVIRNGKSGGDNILSYIMI